MVYLVILSGLIIWRIVPRLAAERQPREIIAVCVISAIAMYYALGIAIRVDTFSPVEAVLMWLHDEMAVGYN
ncbi:MAG: hypothetical protein LBN97_01765 [Oscillospiraceae bacterium]|jgi:hypothetical protein|nr:hypothetical protein [Oscillospiraceae bacterium]